MSAAGPAGDDALHHLGRRAEGGRTLGCVEHAEPAGCPCADVEQAAAGTKGLFGGGDGVRDALALGSDRVGDRAILGDHQVDDADGIGEIDLLVCADCGAR